MLRLIMALGALGIAAAPAAAAVYSAEPAAPLSDTRIVVRDVVWACGAAVCVGQTENSRPLVLCQAFAKKAGRVASFTVNGRAIAQAELDRCNASARPDRHTAVATSR